MLVRDIRPARNGPAVDAAAPQRILVAFDDTAGGWAALHEAIGIALRRNALLTVVVFLPDPPGWMCAPGVGMVPPYSRETLSRDAERAAERLLAAARDEVPATVSVTTRALRGRGARALAREAEHGHHDLVVCAAPPRNAGRFAWLSGQDVSRRLLHRCPVSVLAVRAA